jgi:hypothetical protein
MQKQKYNQFHIAQFHFQIIHNKMDPLFLFIYQNM